MSDKTIRRPMRWISAQDSNVGSVREINEDAILVHPRMDLWAVADGMGGHDAGHVASSMVVRALEHLSPKDSLDVLVDAVEDCLLEANQRIIEFADIMLDGRTVGSTVVVLMIKGRVGVCVWAGDSRLYRCRRAEFVQISRDHSKVEELVEQGCLSRAEGAVHPDANVITRAVGVTPSLCLELTAFEVQQGDTFLLCSDGLYNVVPAGEIRDALLNYSLETSVEHLMQKCLNGGATDNVSLIVVQGDQGGVSRTTTLSGEQRPV